MKLAILILVIVVLVLAVIVGKQMSTDAMAVVVGIVCGIGVSIPTSLLMLYLVSRGSGYQERQEVQPPAMIQPPTVIQYRIDRAMFVSPGEYHAEIPVSRRITGR